MNTEKRFQITAAATLLFALCLGGCNKNENAESLFAPRRDTSDQTAKKAAKPVKFEYDEKYHEGVPEEAKKKWVEAVKYHKSAPHSYDRPLELLDEAVKIYPQYKMGYYTRASILMKKYNDTIDPRVMDKALDDFEKALELGADYVGLYNNLGFALILKGNNLEAIKYLKIALKKKPNSSYILNNLFDAYFKEGDYETADKYLKEAKKIDPTGDVTRHNINKFKEIPKELRHRKIKKDKEKKKEEAPPEKP